MSKQGEHKRVPLTTISTQRSSSMPSVFSRFGSDFMDADAVQPNKSSKSATKSVRLELELFETDMNTYPEFNYSKLLYLEKVTSLRVILFLFLFVFLNNLHVIAEKSKNAENKNHQWQQRSICR